MLYSLCYFFLAQRFKMSQKPPSNLRVPLCIAFCPKTLGIQSGQMNQEMTSKTVTMFTIVTISRKASFESFGRLPASVGLLRFWFSIDHPMSCIIVQKVVCRTRCRISPPVKILSRISGKRMVLPSSHRIRDRTSQMEEPALSRTDILPCL